MLCRMLPRVVHTFFGEELTQKTHCSEKKGFLSLFLLCCALGKQRIMTHSCILLFILIFMVGQGVLFQANSAQAASNWNYARPGLPLSPQQQNVGAGRVRNSMGQGTYAGGALELQSTHDWRLHIRSAAVAHGEMVLLKEIAEPVGPVPTGLWDSLKDQALWPAPPEPGKPLQINKTRLSKALRETLGANTAGRCILPNSLAIQRGGVVLTEHELRNYVVNYLTQQTNAMPGTAEWTEFRLPPYIFLAHGQQKVSLEPGTVAPGRVTFRFVIQEPDGRVLRRAAGAAFLNLWVEVPAVLRPMNKGNQLHVQDITFTRVNAAFLKFMPWDGKGGPWQLARNLGTGEIIYSTDLLGVAMVRKGSIVNLVYNKGNVRMEVKAESLVDGAPGSIIPVRNLQSKKEVYGTVRDSRTVVIE